MRPLRLRRRSVAAAFLSMLIGGTGCVPADSGTPASDADDAVSGGEPSSPAVVPVDPWFTDRALETGIDFEHFNGMSGEYHLGEIMAPGAALFDMDNDGDLDVYLVQGQMLGAGKSLDDALIPPSPDVPRPLSDRLYRNDLEVDADGGRTLRFTDVTDGSGLDVRSYGMGVAAGDFDNDGWVDLYRTRLGANQLFRNNGDGTFRDISRRAGVGDAGWGVSASFLDIDRDGWLDLYVGNYVVYDPQDEERCLTPTGERDYCAPKSY
ncbi:MAG: VCBS repeat-containing protein, partial [Acidobacteria bacterium]|nr:VCBS repeat-containing protein [Acidobacteriota bacterium]